ncbi:helix-turn-helix domain-containing protein [Methylobacterium sp. E-066]|uniref:helix-turn-helix domain-containing protein n=1 Tax=Methylobacterium sp. E-066 TaxID=2836584 RepID=UPI001FBA1BF4|nr:AraC family transcriptional regulator [Methylobacterium sp. E-066]MCJ2144618.1 AraC family transcriptional regulator [Methylobacterium sp. E-066]
MVSLVPSEMLAGTPARAVSAYARGYAGFVEEVGAHVRRVEPARPHVSVIIAFSGKVTVGRIGKPGCELHAFVTGAASGPLLAGHDGQLQCVEIDIVPWASTVLLGAPLTASDDPVALADLLGRDAGTLIECLAAAPGWAERFALLDALFLARLASAARLPRPEIWWAWKQLERSAGAVPIGRLARTIGWSDRHFARCFQDATGLSPKTAARRIRFDRARAMMDKSAITLADVAATCGYSDQSHLTREFGELAGCPPAAYRAACFEDLPGKPASLLGA